MAIIIPIDADVSGLTRKVNQATGSLGKFGKMAGLAAGAAALGGLVATVKVGIDEFMQAEKVTAQTNAVLKSTGGIANVTKRQMDELAGSIMRKSGMDDEAVKSAQNLLLTFTKVRNEAGKNNDIFNQATKITADLSVAFGKDLNSSAILVGKALNDPVKGLAALGRVGIQFTAGQKETIKSLVESGNTMQAQKMILRELETQVGGSAAAYGTTLSGKLDIARETFRNLAGDLVSLVMPALANAAGALGRFISDLSARPSFQAKIDFVFESAGQVASRFWNWWTQPSLETVRSPTSGVRVEFRKPGSQQVNQFVLDLDAAVTGKVTQWAGDLGAAIPQAMFGGVKREGSSLFGGLATQLLKWSNGPYILFRFGKLGFDIAVNFWNNLKAWFDANPGLATAKIREWLTSAGDALGGAAGKVWDTVASQFDGAVRRGRSLLRAETIATKITNDMRAAVQSARSGLAGAASGLAGMLSQIINTNLAKMGVYGNASAMTTEGRDLEDRRAKRQEEELRNALAATEAGSQEQVDAQLALDEFLYNRKAQLRQRDVDDSSASMQRQIEDLAAKFNQGALTAGEFSSLLDGLIGGERGADLGEAFSLGFTNALQSLKNAATDIYNIVGSGPNSQPLGPEIGLPGSFNQGQVTASAEAAYNDAYAKWKERWDKRRQAAIDARKKKGTDGGEKVTKAEWDEIADIMAKWEKQNGNRKPLRSDYGLAKGGIVTGPRYLVGEGEFNEAVIPLGSNTAAEMMRKAFADSVSGGAQTTYNVTVNAGLGVDGVDVGRQIVEAIKVFERRNGPVFAGA